MVKQHALELLYELSSLEETIAHLESFIHLYGLDVDTNHALIDAYQCIKREQRKT